jgi:hypothetical protein
MWQTEDVTANRLKNLTEEERKEASKCKLCSKVTLGACRNWHLLSECKGSKQNAARRAVLQAVDRVLNKLKINQSLRELIRLPWKLDRHERLLDFENLNQIRQHSPVQHRALAAALRDVVRAGAAEGEGELKLAREARQMIYKGMLGAAWDNLMVSFGMDREVVTKLRWKLQTVCVDAVCDIWRAYNGAVQKVARAKAVKENPGFGETLEAAVEAKYREEWRSGRAWKGEERLRNREHAAQLRWAYRTLRECRLTHESRASTAAGMKKIEALDEMGASLRRWLGLGSGDTRSAAEWAQGLDGEVRSIARAVLETEESMRRGHWGQDQDAGADDMEELIDELGPTDFQGPTQGVNMTASETCGCDLTSEDRKQTSSTNLDRFQERESDHASQKKEQEEIETGIGAESSRGTGSGRVRRELNSELGAATRAEQDAGARLPWTALAAEHVTKKRARARGEAGDEEACEEQTGAANAAEDSEGEEHGGAAARGRGRRGDGTGRKRSVGDDGEACEVAD